MIMEKKKRANCYRKNKTKNYGKNIEMIMEKIKQKDYQGEKI